jgi:hypothetical protein
LIFNGSSDYREVLGTTTDWALGTTWTIEWWSKAAGASGPGTIYTVMSQYDHPNGIGIDIYYQGGNLLINNGTTLATEPTPGVWTHVALVNTAGTMTLYYNGTSVYTGGNWNLGFSTGTLVIGKRGQIPFQYFAGKLTNIRITNTAVYTGTFNPFVTSYPPAKVTGTRLLMNPTDFNTVLDLSDSSHTFGGSCGGGNDYPAPPTYTITPAASSINEGSGLTFTVGGTNINNGTYYWTINNTTTSNADFSAVSGSFTITSNSGSFTVTPTADTTTEGSETFTVSIRSVSTSGTILATSSSVTINDTSQTPASGVPTGSIVGRWNSPGAGQFGGDPEIWPEASGYSWAKFYHLVGYTPASNGTIGYSSDGSSSYIQTPIHMTPSDFTLAFTARLNPTGTFPQGIFDCSQPGAYTGLRAYWTDATHIVITSPGTGTAAIDMTGSGWHTYGPSFFTIRMKLDSLAGTGSIDIFVNGTAWSNVGAPRGANGFPEADAGINMILGALVDDSGTKVGFLDSTWFNFIYYSRALSNSEVTQLYTAQQNGLLNPTPATTYSFVSNFTAGQASSNIYISIGFGGMGPRVPPDQMGGWYVSGPGIADVATVTSITNIVNDSQFYVTIDTSILQASGTYTFTAP